jgi:CMP-N-acetylneuraminic acid synthetase
MDNYKKMNDKTIGVILVRSKSKTIKHKNIKKINGVRLINYALSELLKSKICDKIIISSDSSVYLSIISKQFPKQIELFKRSNFNARDVSSSESSLLEVIKSYKKTLNDFNNCIFLQITSPLVSQIDFKNAKKNFNKNRLDSLFTGFRSKKFFWTKTREKFIPLNYNYYLRPRRQQFKGSIVENGAFYIFNIKKFLKQKNRLFGKIGCHIMPESRSVEIDNNEDIKLLKFYLNKNNV